MRLWRLTRAAHAALDGEGARRFGGRWNAPGRAVVYTAADAALTVLEVRVHLDLPLDLLPDDYVLLGIDTGPLEPETGPALTDPDACRDFGERWLGEARSALLAVPSVIVPESSDVLINPRHPDSAAVRLVSRRTWRFDPRLF
ncbi:MAG: RES family NAD+ phosphorylase [Candidatus Competibacterales bacterium]|nr:RES family NAD+ phosphorylase [Candidatus Competibacterales bacterium]